HGGNEARLAFDGNNNTFWHTEYQGSEPSCPHTLIVDMGIPYWVTAFTYLARQDGNQNGMVKAYEVYLSNDGKTWGTPVVSGEFKNTTALQIAKLNTTTMGRYIKFVAKSEINGRAWTSAAEIGIQAESDATAINLPKTTSTSLTGYYDLQGRRLNNVPNRKGIYIQNGKKILY
ncbi:MAG: discoidin domain-containing protein, partial [Prevotella sp.]|nr:discoidin domain-containing protein [Prevotella sp.]